MDLDEEGVKSLYQKSYFNGDEYVNYENEVDSRMPVPVFSRMDGCFTTKFVVNDTFCDAKDCV